MRTANEHTHKKKSTHYKTENVIAALNQNGAKGTTCSEFALFNPLSI